MEETSQFQAVIDVVEQLSVEDQARLLEIIYRRLIEHRREDLLGEIAEARQSYQVGQVKRGSAVDLMADLLE